jgi:hypothetical protein
LADPYEEGEERTAGSGNFITREFVEKNKNKVYKLAQLGCTQKEIGYTLNCSVSVIKDHFIDEFRSGQANLKSSIRKAQIESAVREKNSSLLIWLGKNLLDQKEPRQEMNHSGDLTINRVVFSKNDKTD